MKNKYSFKAAEIISKFCLSEFLRNENFLKKNHFCHKTLMQENSVEDRINGIGRKNGYILYFDGDVSILY